MGKSYINASRNCILHNVTLSFFVYLISIFTGMWSLNVSQ